MSALHMLQQQVDRRAIVDNHEKCSFTTECDTIVIEHPKGSEGRALIMTVFQHVNSTMSYESYDIVCVQYTW